MESRLSVTSNALDVREIRRRLANASPYQILHHLAKTHINDIHGRVRFSDKTPLPELAYIVYDGFKVIDTEANEETMEGVDSFALARLENVEMGKIESMAKKLGTYESADPEFREALNQFANLDQSAVEGVIEAAKFAMGGIPAGAGNAQANLQSELVNRKIYQHPVFRKLDELQIAWTEPGEQGAGRRFTEVADHYVE